MKLYGAPKPAPNPRRVRMFLAETPIDISKREHKSADYRRMNSLGQAPTLELDDGTVISETVAICRYFEALHPEPALFGRTAVEKALVARCRAWTSPTGSASTSTLTART